MPSSGERALPLRQLLSLRETSLFRTLNPSQQRTVPPDNHILIKQLTHSFLKKELCLRTNYGLNIAWGIKRFARPRSCAQGIYSLIRVMRYISKINQKSKGSSILFHSASEKVEITVGESRAHIRPWDTQVGKGCSTEGHRMNKVKAVERERF